MNRPGPDVRQSGGAAIAADLPDADALLAALGGPFRRAFRIHPRRGTPGGWLGLSPVPWCAAGRFHADDEDPDRYLDRHTGCIWPQDAASLLPVEMLDPRPGETVIDCCAAPGSKSTQIGLRLGDDPGSLLVCCDASAPRRALLAESLARQGIACGVVTPMPVEHLAQRKPGCADAVLVDAPCSGHALRSLKQVARMAERQLALLGTAAQLVRPGGRLVYSTCTPWRAEDEGVIAGFLAAHPGWSMEAIVLPGADGDLAGGGGLRLWPQRQGTEPFFACRLRGPDRGPEQALAGREPRDGRHLRPWLPETPLITWTAGAVVLAATPAAASCALPSDARGLLLGRLELQGLRLQTWAAQACIERGATARAIDRATAVQVWAGVPTPIGEAGDLVATADGAPIGILAAADRLDLPSRLRRSGLMH